MPGIEANLPAAERVVLAVDTSKESRAEELAGVARDAGARVVKLGLELSSATSWKYCSELAAEHGIDWVADAKTYDIGRTTAALVNNLAELDHPPAAITIGTKSGIGSMRSAQEVAQEADITMLGVTLLTSIDEDEAKAYEKASRHRVVWRESRRAVAAGIGGLVCSPKEVGMVKRFKRTQGLDTMIPGTRSVGAAHQDQKNVTTPGVAIEYGGADTLVIGSQVTGANDPVEAFNSVVEEIAAALHRRNERLRGY